jgi:hypothetical protein
MDFQAVEADKLKGPLDHLASCEHEGVAGSQAKINYKEAQARQCERIFWGFSLMVGTII